MSVHEFGHARDRQATLPDMPPGIGARRHASTMTSAAHGLEVTLRFTESLALVRLSGELTAENVHVLHDAIAAVAVPESEAPLLVDASGLSSIDETGRVAVDAACLLLRTLGRPVSHRMPTPPAAPLA